MRLLITDLKGKKHRIEDPDLVDRLLAIQEEILDLKAQAVVSEVDAEWKKYNSERDLQLKDEEIHRLQQVVDGSIQYLDPHRK